MLPDRRTLLLTLCTLPVAGCGFAPVYRQGGAASGLHGQIRPNLIESREGFELMTRLDERLGAPRADARFDMTVDLTFRQDELILDVTNGITRYTLNGTAKISLTDRTTVTVVLTDIVRDTAGYSGTAQTAQTEAAKRDAYTRLAIALADKIVLRLTSTAESWAG